MPVLKRRVDTPLRLASYGRRLLLASLLPGALLSFLTLSAVAPAAAGLGRTPEYDLKAVFLFQFAHFVTWPERSFPNETTPITIGVLGEDPFGAALDEIVADESIGTRKLVVRRYRVVDQVDACQVLFISPSEAARLPSILAKLKGRSVLTVGDTKDFVSQDGVIGFILDRKRLKLRVNLAAADSADLTISSKLLRQAEVVRKGGKQ